MYSLTNEALIRGKVEVPALEAAIDSYVKENPGHAAGRISLKVAGHTVSGNLIQTGMDYVFDIAGIVNPDGSANGQTTESERQNNEPPVVTQADRIAFAVREHGLVVLGGNWFQVGETKFRGFRAVEAAHPEIFDRPEEYNPESLPDMTLGAAPEEEEK